ncbi:MAG: 7TM diverse intracellular signaling domain-containing protein, partial [Burkholderiaceae bacterium]
MPIKPEQVRVLVEQSSEMSLDDAQTASDQFKQANEVGPIVSTKAYWLMFQLKNQASSDRDYRLINKTFGLLNLNVYLIHENGDLAAFSRNHSMLTPGNRLAEVSPFIAHEPPIESQYLVLPLRRNETVTIYARAIPDQRFLPKQFNFLSVVDHAKYLELRRYGLYIEGTLAGALVVLTVFGWYSYFRNRDRTSLRYGIWIVFALGSVLVLGVHDGQRLAEFFIRLDDYGVASGGMTVRQTFFYFFPAGQSITYVLFARSFLDTRERFPWFHHFSTSWIVFYVLQFSVNVFTEHTIPPNWLWNPLLIWLVAVLLGVYICAFIRLREGMKIARFFMIAMVPYLFFRSLFLLGVVGLPSPVALLPDTGIFFQLKDTNSMQGFGVVCEALIMALAVVARSRWLQDELTASIQEQKNLVENQNKILEETVQARTLELTERHRELDEAHR